MRIGIAADVNLEATGIYNSVEAQMGPKDLVDVIQRYGHVPVILPLVEATLIPKLLDIVDALILPGGNDIHPSYYAQAPHPQLGLTYRPRDEMDIALIKQAAQRKLPIFGICRGMQVANIALGGSLYQDLPSQYEGALIQHRQRAKADEEHHEITLVPDSFCGTVLGERAFVNSLHHQAVKEVASGFKVTANAEDGVIEALEHETLPIILVQWHPENLWRRCEQQARLFETFFNRI